MRVVHATMGVYGRPLVIHCSHSFAKRCLCTYVDVCGANNLSRRRSCLLIVRISGRMRGGDSKFAKKNIFNAQLYSVVGLCPPASRRVSVCAVGRPPCGPVFERCEPTQYSRCADGCLRWRAALVRWPQSLHPHILLSSVISIGCNISGLDIPE